ncbi:Hint domain-containing protein [Maritimibacter sp. DP1N21-5]|uniref:Hint domain-containing protein n=1 Tax=Maritimibacter sp. DP1N21-5 TaxID=2836867 RepID=UPI001C491EBA|nr:Hint domain-containing protein [Maritimibacter sp. DP1N21-5]MBV7407760.1 choice-of-anchor L domain-containing protein [Maritimibacter sp. DP1N21-5]
MATGQELPINTGASALQMANTIFGEGVTVVSATYTGDNRSSGIYSNGDTVSPEITPADSGVLLSTGNLADFTQRNGDPNRSASTSTDTSGQNNNALFNALAGASTYDASYITADVIPTGDTISLQFVFSSEEYPEYAGSIYNDIVGVWVNGQPATMTIGTGKSSVGNINGSSNENLYVSNTGDQYNTEMDGFTVTMTVKMSVIPNVVNTIRIGIADVGDASYDSTLLIAAESGQSAVIAHDDELSIGLGGTKTIDVLSNDDGPGSSTLTITHVNGIAVVAGDTVTLTTGQQVTLNPNGTFTVVNGTDIESVNFSYTVASGGGAGASDSAFVTINSIPCFVAGTRIDTPSGAVPVESLSPGDLVLTLDQGPQPVRWIGMRRVAATGLFAPIEIRANTFGTHGTLRLSPLHRVLIRDGMAELLFGEPEVLIAAKNLVNDRSVRRVEGGDVDYVHVLFDRHQVIYSEGLATESFLPGPHIIGGFEAEIAAEILSLFPELDPVTGTGFPAAARKMLKGYEARLLLPQGAAA